MEMEFGNKLCYSLSGNISFNISKKLFKREVVYAFDSILGWERYSSDLKIQVPVKMGVSIKFIDILISKNSVNLFVIEIKKPAVSLDSHKDK